MSTETAFVVVIIIGAMLVTTAYFAFRR